MIEQECCISIAFLSKNCEENLQKAKCCKKTMQIKTYSSENTFACADSVAELENRQINETFDAGVCLEKANCCPCVRSRI